MGQGYGMHSLQQEKRKNNTGKYLIVFPYVLVKDLGPLSEVYYWGGQN